MDASHDTKLTTAAGIYNLLVPNRHAVHQRRGEDVALRLADAALVVPVEPPRVDAARLGDDEVGVDAGIAGDDGGRDVVQARGRGQDARGAELAVDAVLAGVPGGREAELVAVDAAEGEEGAVVGDGEGVVLAADEGGDAAAAGEGLDLGGLQDNGAVLGTTKLIVIVLVPLPLGTGDAELAKVVEAPGPGAALVVEGEAVVGAGGDGDDADAAAEGAAAGAEGRGLGVALDDAAAELVLLGGAPGLDLAAVVEGENVVGARGEGDDLAGLVEEDRSVLDVDVLGEAQDAIGGL